VTGTVHKAARRIMIAALALVGKLDADVDMAQTVAAREATIAQLRTVIRSVHEQRQYWFNLWFTMGREFEVTQESLIKEIDELRSKLGMSDSKYQDLIKHAFHDKYVAPAAHPVSGIRTETSSIDVPPTVPKEAQDGSA
jgi:hypothetical protein